MDTTQMPNLDVAPEGAVQVEDKAPPMMQQAPRMQPPMQHMAAHANAAAEPGDESLMVEFFRHPLKEEDYISIRIPGDKLYQPVFEVNEYWKARFSMQWNAYSQQKSQLEGQTLLSECAWADQGMRDHLAAYGVKTVEGLAGVSDGNLDQLGPGARTLRDKAVKFVEEKKKVEQFDVQAAENDALRKQISDMAARLEDLENKATEPKTRSK